MIEVYTYIKTLISTTIIEHTILKFVSSFVFVVGSFLFAGLPTNGLVALIILIVVDYVAAVSVEKKNGELISSKKSIKTPIKILVYYTMIASGRLVEYGVPQQIHFIDDTILSFLLITEFISIIRHLGELGYQTPNKLINNLKEYVEEKDIVKKNK